MFFYLFKVASGFATSQSPLSPIAGIDNFFDDDYFANPRLNAFGARPVKHVLERNNGGANGTNAIEKSAKVTTRGPRF